MRTPIDTLNIPKRSEGQKDVLELRHEPIKNVRVAFVGLGMRVIGAIKSFMFIDGVEIKVLNDIVPENIRKAKNVIEEHRKTNLDTYSESDDWKRICEREDIDLVYISTHYELHTPIAVYAMQCGKHVAVEVPAAFSIEECWRLVDTAEKTQKHCFQLENCNYDPFELNTLNMVQKGLFGNIIHGEGAYIHDIKELIFSKDKGYWKMWRLKYHEQFDGNLYPTHGLGPICHKMNIHRGDKLEYLVSMSTGQFGLKQYVENFFSEDPELSKKEFKSGDMNNTLIKTRKGKTILLQHDVTSPRPYSRIQIISGTKGFARKWPKVEFSFDPQGLRPLTESEIDKLLVENEHPVFKNIKSKHTEITNKYPDLAKHDGMDFIMNYRLIYCLRNGLPLDQDVYDAAEWSSIIELSTTSVENQSMPAKIPDFTRGAWDKINKITYYV